MIPRSFYYPPNPMMCADCHMPLVPSKDDGNINGFVHSHRFPGANTAVLKGDMLTISIAKGGTGVVVPISSFQVEVQPLF